MQHAETLKSPAPGLPTQQQQLPLLRRFSLLRRQVKWHFALRPSWTRGKNIQMRFHSIHQSILGLSRGGQSLNARPHLFRKIYDHCILARLREVVTHMTTSTTTTPIVCAILMGLGVGIFRTLYHFFTSAKRRLPGGRRRRAEDFHHQKCQNVCLTSTSTYERRRSSSSEVLWAIGVIT